MEDVVRFAESLYEVEKVSVDSNSPEEPAARVTSLDSLRQKGKTVRVKRVESEDTQETTNVTSFPIGKIKQAADN